MNKKANKLTGPALRIWIQEHNIPEKMLWESAAFDQFSFFDNLASVLIGWKRWHHDDDGEYLFDEKKPNPDLVVVSTHTSKSIKLPVVRYRACARNLIVLLRHNFFDYCATFYSNTSIDAEFFSLPVKEISCGFEGFKPNQIKDVYKPGCKEFSVQTPNKYQMWTVCFLVRSALERDLKLEL